MADSTPVTVPTTPSVRPNRPMSEALLNEKVHHLLYTAFLTTELYSRPSPLALCAIHGTARRPVLCHAPKHHHHVNYHKDSDDPMLTSRFYSGTPASALSSSALPSVPRSVSSSPSFCSSEEHGPHLSVSVSVPEELGKSAIAYVDAMFLHSDPRVLISYNRASSAPQLHQGTVSEFLDHKHFHNEPIACLKRSGRSKPLQIQWPLYITISSPSIEHGFSKKALCAECQSV